MRARILAMSERNPRSKLRSMKRRYFWTTVAVYLGVFLFAYLMLEVLFMIFEAGPYTRLSAYAVLFVVSGVITDHIINQTLKDRWRREAPDILDVIKAPEPAYIPDGTERNEQPGTPENKREVRHLRRTQHKELEQEIAEVKAPAPVTAQPEAGTMDEQHENKRKKSERRRFSRKKKTEDALANTAGFETDHPEEPGEASSWMKGLNEMDTVEFEDAVLALDPNRSSEKSSSRENSELPSAGKKNKRKRRSGNTLSEDSQSGNRERSKNKPLSAEPNPKPKNQRRRTASAAVKQDTAERRNPAPEPKPSAWTGKLEDMDTVEIEEAMERISAVTEEQNKRKN